MAVRRVVFQKVDPLWSQLTDFRTLRWVTDHRDTVHPHFKASPLTTAALGPDRRIVLFRDVGVEELNVENDTVPIVSAAERGRDVRILLDERATIGDLRFAAQVFRDFATLHLVWRSSELADASAFARYTFPMTDFASLALASRSVELRVNGVVFESPIHLAVESPHSIDAPDDALVRDWLRQTSSDGRYYVIDVTDSDP